MTPKPTDHDDDVIDGDVDIIEDSISSAPSAATGTSQKPQKAKSKARGLLLMMALMAGGVGFACFFGYHIIQGQNVKVAQLESRILELEDQLEDQLEQEGLVQDKEFQEVIATFAKERTIQAQDIKALQETLTRLEDTTNTQNKNPAASLNKALLVAVMMHQLAEQDALAGLGNIVQALPDSPDKQALSDIIAIAQSAPIARLIQQGQSLVKEKASAKCQMGRYQVKRVQFYHLFHNGLLKL